MPLPHGPHRQPEAGALPLPRVGCGDNQQPTEASSAMPKFTALISSPRCIEHDTGPGHPERPQRIQALENAIEGADAELRQRLDRREARLAGEDELELVHPATHIDRIRAAALKARESQGLVFLDPDTVVSPGSWDAALAAAGAALTAIDAILDGEARNAFCLVRPPGHHATIHRAMGFCLFNNVAIGARYAQSRGIERILIVDWDVHHGNGTEEIFDEDPDIFYLSMHQAPHYPGTGLSTHRGRGSGQGTTLNLPVPPGLPAERYVSELTAGLEQAVEEFIPDLVMVSAGFDAAEGDPLAGLTLRPQDYHILTRELMEIATRHCADRLVSLLEGGYNLEMLASCGIEHIRALCGLGP